MRPIRIRPFLRRLGGREAPASASAAAVEDYWGQIAAGLSECPAFPGSWTENPVVRAAVMRRISGDERTDWLEWARDRCLTTPAGRALSLACGAGYTEREAIRCGLCRAIEGVDLSPLAIDTARKRARAKGMTTITYRVADLNAIELEPDSYDLVIAKQAIHHVAALEHLLDQVRQALRPAGLFLVNEYVGPSRFQWTDDQLAIMNALLPLLPERLRRYAGPGGGIRSRIERIPPESHAAEDPGEAVRSAEIVPLIAERFELVARRDFGGTILAPLLERIVQNFDPADEKDHSLLQLLLAFEELLLRHRVISSDFTVLVAGRPR
jgi:SAM-dependent methyltransferase